MEREQIVSREPSVISGALVFTRTHVPVQIPVDDLKAGETFDRFLEGFPTVNRERAEAFLKMAVEAAGARSRGAPPGR